MDILKKIWKLIIGSAGKLRAVLNDGKDVANQIKAVADSKLLDAVVKATPTLIDDVGLAAIRGGLAAFIVIMGWAELFLKNMEAADPDAKAAVLTVINAKAAVLVAKQKGVILPIQQALASAPVVYNPAIVNQ